MNDRHGVWRRTLLYMGSLMGLAAVLEGCEPIEERVAEGLENNCGGLDECFFEVEEKGDGSGCNATDANEVWPGPAGVFTCCITGEPKYLQCEVDDRERGDKVKGIGQSRVPLWTFEDNDNNSDKFSMFSGWVIGRNCNAGVLENVTLSIFMVEGTFVQKNLGDGPIEDFTIEQVPCIPDGIIP